MAIEPVLRAARGNIAAWFSAVPYGIYATADGHLALSMSSMDALAAAFELPAFAGVAESDAFAPPRGAHPGPS